MTLDDQRRATADQIYENYDFGYQVKDANGWTWEGDVAEKVIFFENEESPGAESYRGVLTIEFAPDLPIPLSAKAVVRGEEVGNIAGGTLADYVVESENPRTP